MKKIDVNNNQKTLLELIKCSLFELETDLILSQPLEWSDLLQEAQDQTVVGLITPTIKKWAENHDVPNLSQWNRISDRLYAYYVWSLQAQAELVKLFSDNNIPLVILKGNSVAVLYPVPKYRTMGDIDFLVPWDRYEESQVLMEKCGYKKAYGSNEDVWRHIGYTKNGVVFELHKRFSSSGLDIENELKKGLIHPNVGNIAGMSFPMLPPLENGLVLLMHIRQHLLESSSNLGLRQIIDWMMYVNYYCGCEIEQNVTWDDCFMSLAQKYGLDKLASTVTFICKEWIGLLNAPKWCDKADKNTAEELLKMVMTSGNFGVKLESGKAVETVRSKIRNHGLFRWLQIAGKNNWKAYHKHQWLKPFCWLYQIFRYAKQGFKSGRTHEQLSEDFDRSKNKLSLLRELGIGEMK